jgi:hypothetical protein
MHKRTANTRHHCGIPSAALVLTWTTVALLVLAVSSLRADAVVGTGTPVSCTEAALNSALAVGGPITFRLQRR